MPSESSDGIGVGESAGRSNRTVIPAQAGIQTCPHGNLSVKRFL
ncbi:hypothetical protein ACI611_000950 [Neisseria gonorrhoeae]